MARAVIDASGTWGAPNPMGVDGLPVEGERAAGDRIAYGIPDVLGRDRADYAGRQVLVVGGGHSAINVVLDLLRLQEDDAGDAGGLGAAARRHRSAARRRAQRPTAGARRARAGREAGDRGRAARDAGALRGGADRDRTATGCG